jgi:hypothetical protein
MVHRNIYTTWISKVTGPGKTELLLPSFGFEIHMEEYCSLEEHQNQGNHVPLQSTTTTD